MQSFPYIHVYVLLPVIDSVLKCAIKNKFTFVQTAAVTINLSYLIINTHLLHFGGKGMGTSTHSLSPH